MNRKEKKIKTEYLYQGNIINLYRDLVLLPNQKQGVREYVAHPGAAAILPVDNDNILLVSQFRYPYKQILLEIPAGKIDPNESPEEAAIRELREEVGAICDKITFLGKIYPSPGYCNEIIYLYVAEEFSISTQLLDDGEFVRVEKVKFTDALEMINSGKIVDAKTIIAILKYHQLKGETNDSGKVQGKKTSK